MEYIDISRMDKKKINLVINELEDLLGLRTEDLNRAKSSLRMNKHIDVEVKDTGSLNKIVVLLTALLLLLFMLFM